MRDVAWILYNFAGELHKQVALGDVDNGWTSSPFLSRGRQPAEYLCSDQTDRDQSCAAEPVLNRFALRQ